LGVFDVAANAFSAQAPLMVLAGLFIVYIGQTGQTGIPIAVIAVSLILRLFAVGFLRMVLYVRSAGAFYTYIARGLGRPVGVGAALPVWAGYTLLQVGLYGIFGSFTAACLQGWFDLTVPWWLPALAVLIIVGVVSITSIQVSGLVLRILMSLELLAVLVATVVNIVDAKGTLTWDTAAAPLSPALLLASGSGAMLVVAYLAMVGQELPAGSAEEARNPYRTTRLATSFCLFAVSVLYSLALWAMQVALGDSLVGRAQAEGPNLFFTLAGERLGPIAGLIGQLLFLTSALAGLLAFHNTGARYSWSLGREGVTTRWLAQTNRFSAPQRASLLQTAIGMAVITTAVLRSWDPLTLFLWAGGSGAVAILTILTLTAFAVPMFFRRTPLGENVWRRKIAPYGALFFLTILIVMVYRNLDTLLGVPPGAAITRILPATLAALFAVGVGWALILKHTRPDVYDAIGYGSETAPATGLRLTPTQRETEPIITRAQVQR
jgi:amino acid transporter